MLFFSSLMAKRVSCKKKTAKAKTGKRKMSQVAQHHHKPSLPSTEVIAFTDTNSP